MLTNLFQIACQHIEHIHGVFVVLFVHVLLFILDIGFDILHQSLGELGEVVDIVQGIQNTVDQSLGELTHSNHLLLLNELILGTLHLSRPLLDNLFQKHFVSFQLSHAQLGNDIDKYT